MAFKKRPTVSLLLVMLFYASVFPWSARGACFSYYDQCVGDVTGNNTSVISGIADFITRGPWVDVRAYMDGQSGRPTLAQWEANQSGTDVTTAIQAAINSITTGTVYFPEGIYIVSSSDNTVCLKVKSNIRFYGDGIGISNIKVSSSAGRYHRIIGGTTLGTEVSNFTLEKITVDSNNTGNAAIAADLTPTYPRISLYLSNDSSSGLYIRQSEFKDYVSINTIYSGINNTNIKDCVFSFGTSGFPTFKDHSTIYVHADNASVIGNKFFGVAGDKNCVTAIETHGSNQVVFANVITNYAYGMNITGIDIKDNINILVLGNTISGATFGIHLWSETFLTHTLTYGIDGAIIAANTINLSPLSWEGFSAGSTAGILFDPLDNLATRNIQITNNTISWIVDDQPRTLNPPVSHGIGGFSGAGTNNIYKSLRIDGNTIVNAPLQGIYFNAVLVDSTISNNVIINPGSTTNGSPNENLRTGIMIGGSNTNGLIISENYILDDYAISKISSGIFLAAITPTGIEVSNNTIRLKGNGASLVSELRINDDFQLPYVKHISNSTSPITATAKVRGGSEYRIPTLNKNCQVVTDNTATWHCWTYRTAAPADGTWAAGDMAYKTGATDNVVGWRCTVAGTPGTWKYIQGTLEP